MDHVCSAGGDEGRATCKVLMKSPIEMIARDGKRTRLNGASDVVGGIAAVLGTNPSRGSRHAGLCAPPPDAMWPAPSPDPGVYIIFLLLLAYLAN
jgi:hypothetical protein